MKYACLPLSLFAFVTCCNGENGETIDADVDAARADSDDTTRDAGESCDFARSTHLSIQNFSMLSLDESVLQGRTPRVLAALGIDENGNPSDCFSLGKTVLDVRED